MQEVARRGETGGPIDGGAEPRQDAEGRPDARPRRSARGRARRPPAERSGAEASRLVMMLMTPPTASAPCSDDPAPASSSIRAMSSSATGMSPLWCPVCGSLTRMPSTSTRDWPKDAPRRLMSVCEPNGPALADPDARQQPERVGHRGDGQPRQIVGGDDGERPADGARGRRARRCRYDDALVDGRTAGWAALPVAPAALHDDQHGGSNSHPADCTVAVRYTRLLGHGRPPAEARSAKGLSVSPRFLASLLVAGSWSPRRPWPRREPVSGSPTTRLSGHRPAAPSRASSLPQITGWLDGETLARARGKVWKVRATDGTATLHQDPATLTQIAPSGLTNNPVAAPPTTRCASTSSTATSGRWTCPPA